ncbi:hypothetical protein P7C73_g2604, partial [Tremellales sp. Uapishka_1]
MQTNDPGHLFQTTKQLNDAADHARKVPATEKIGDPIHVSGKVLALEIRGQQAWTAESGWQARRLDLRTGKTKRLYKGHKGPVTSLALLDIASTASVPAWQALFTGSWDKTIKIWNSESGELVTTLEGHSDFVKSLTIIPGSSPFLLSTSSDRTFRLWALRPLLAGDRPFHLQTIKDHTRPIECVAWSEELDANSTPTGEISVWTGDSMGIIKQWLLKSGRLEHAGDLKAHETSVAEMTVVDEGIWSVSMDNTAVFHSPPSSPSSHNHTIPHSRYVKSVLSLPDVVPGKSLLLTGSEDEDIRVWDVSAVQDDRTKLLATVQGHCGEVSCIRRWLKEDGESGTKSWMVVSGSLDGTLRRWTIQDLLHPTPIDYEPTPEEDTSGGMTAEEERELAELMSDDE